MTQKLTVEQHLLQKLSEECCEVSQAVSKALLFGLHDTHETYGNNHDRIVIEVHDILGVLAELVDRGIITMPVNPVPMIEAKREKILKYLSYADEKGMIAHD